ncbi:MAG: phosphatase PAP2 family protein [Paludibacteraceae bacterium]|nr:phosphatase PAP2 family protein [Paludibacteraceae bacterium]
MNRLLHISAQALSVLLYPLFIPTYGMLLFWAVLSANSGDLLPLAKWMIIVGTTSIFTLVFPLLIILMMIYRKRLDDIQIREPEQRTLPYLYTFTCYLCWCIFIARIHLPYFLLHTAIGATVALVAVMLINTRWKISAHLTAWGGLLGGIADYCLWTNRLPARWILLSAMLITCLLMYARIILKAHTPEQTAAGLLLGLIATAGYDTAYTLLTA